MLLLTGNRSSVADSLFCSARIAAGGKAAPAESMSGVKISTTHSPHQWNGASVRSVTEQITTLWNVWVWRQTQDLIPDSSPPAEQIVPSARRTCEKTIPVMDAILPTAICPRHVSDVLYAFAASAPEDFAVRALNFLALTCGISISATR